MKSQEDDKKLKDLMKSINTMMKNQPQIVNENDGNVKQNIKIEEKDNKDYINVHKMMVEMSVKFPLYRKLKKMKIHPMWITMKTLRKR